LKRFGKILVLTLGVIGLSLVLSIATSREVRAAVVSALVTVSNTPANPVPTQSVDAKNAFQANLIGLGFSSQQITIPSGQRLVVDFVGINGAANSLSGPIQPSIILQSSLNGGGAANYYLQPGSSPINIPGANQLYLAQQVKVYADTLTVATGYAGFAPSTFVFNIAISGHLIPIP
jgi:hypothetical protein